MRIFVVLVLAAVATSAYALGPTVNFTLPVENATPSVWGQLPFPDDLYFDQGQPGDGDGTLLDAGSSIGLGVDVIRTNTASVEDALDLLDGFGTTSAVWFFFSGAVDVASLPASPVLAPTLSDAVFCADTATLTPVPLAIKFDVDTRVPNILALLPLPGRPLQPKTRYVCVVRRSVTGGGDAVEPSADWVSVRDGASPNGDADAIFDPVVAALGTAGVPASEIAGMTVFTTESTTDDLVRIRGPGGTNEEAQLVSSEWLRGSSKISSSWSCGGTKSVALISNVVGPVLVTLPSQQKETRLSGAPLSMVRWNLPIGPPQLAPVDQT